MNKTEFLNELRTNVTMLEDDEQNDIINEYSQHIDMKVQDGMTEAEAIDDFGPLDELVGEILAAYHVKAPEKSTPSTASSFIDGGKQMADAAMDATKRGYSKLKVVAHQAIEKGKDKASAAAEYDFDLDPIMKSAGKHTRKAASVTKRTAIRLWGICAVLAKNCARWCWNGLVILTSLCCLLGAACLIFSFGFSIVLLVQGYPLGGVTVALLGASVSLTCLTLLLFRLIWPKKVSSQNHAPTSNTPTESADVPLSFPQPANEVMHP